MESWSASRLPAGDDGWLAGCPTLVLIYLI